MPIHDWTRVDAGIFHHFHLRWIAAISDGLNEGLLPDGYYAMAEQVAGQAIPDVIALHAADPGRPVGRGAGWPSPVGGAAVFTPPRAQFHETATRTQAARLYAHRTRAVVVRHVTGDRVAAIIEIVSPGNKSSRRDFRPFVDKIIGFLQAGVHMLLADLFPPGPGDPNGVHRAVWSGLSRTRFRLPADKPLTLASYLSAPPAEAFVEPVAVNDTLPPMPLFLTPDTHVPVPLEASYMAAWVRVPARWRDVIDPPAEAAS